MVVATCTCSCSHRRSCCWTGRTKPAARRTQTGASAPSANRCATFDFCVSLHCFKHDRCGARTSEVHTEEARGSRPIAAAAGQRLLCSSLKRSRALTRAAVVFPHVLGYCASQTHHRPCSFMHVRSGGIIFIFPPCQVGGPPLSSGGHQADHDQISLTDLVTGGEAPEPDAGEPPQKASSVGRLTLCMVRRRDCASANGPCVSGARHARLLRWWGQGVLCRREPHFVLTAGRVSSAGSPAALPGSADAEEPGRKKRKGTSVKSKP